MDASEELEAVTQLFINMGADPGQAQVMAGQLLKRADRLAKERGISKVEAADSLLRQVVQARQGIAPSSNTEQNGPEGQKKLKK